MTLCTVLLGYGFTLANNPCDEVMVRLGKPPDPVLKVLNATLPTHFTLPWEASQGTFYLRGPKHYSGGYDHGMPGLRGIPVEMFHMITEMAYLMSTGDEEGAGEITVGSEQYGIVLEEFLFPLRQKLAMIQKPMEEVEGEPRNSKQVFAKRYRDGQVEILATVIKELEEYLGGSGG